MLRLPGIEGWQPGLIPGANATLHSWIEFACEMRRQKPVGTNLLIALVVYLVGGSPTPIEALFRLNGS
jgi:hypothetical protein